MPESVSSLLAEARRDPRRAVAKFGAKLRRSAASHLVDHDRPKPFTINLDFPVDPRPRYGYGKPPHGALYELFDSERPRITELLRNLLDYSEQLSRIPFDRVDDESPFWFNGQFQGIDAMALYGIVASRRPARYIEIGSGNSTKFARRSALDNGVDLHITSVDPEPRAEIDRLCDRVVRRPLEDVDLGMFDELQSGDIFFLDGSHRSFENSDATVALVEVLPRLAPGVLVHVHDIFLPWDYPPQMAGLYYSEQYLLASYLLAKGSLVEVMLPNFFVCLERELHEVLAPFWSTMTWVAVPSNGTSMWLRRCD